MEDPRVLFGIFIPTQVLLTLIWIFSVSHLVQVGERLRFDTCGKSGRSLWLGTLGWPQWDVLELRLADLLVGASEEGFLLRIRAHSTQALVIFAWVNIGIT